MWHRLCEGKELDLFSTLKSAQAFRWKNIQQESQPEIWRGVVGGYIFSLKSEENNVYYQCHNCKFNENAEEIDVKPVLDDYFQLGISLPSLQKDWCHTPENSEEISKNTQLLKNRLKELLDHLPSLRLMRQNPRESFFAFICSQNSNVARIISAVNGLSTEFGTELGEVDGEKYYCFPSFSKLSKVEPSKLKEMGLGYRANYIPLAALQVIEKAQESENLPRFEEYQRLYNDDNMEDADRWLLSLRSKPLEEVETLLQDFCGIGPKVADCISLSSLDQFEAIPVDTHVRQLAEKYISNIPSKVSMNKVVYKKIGDGFRQCFSRQAGWAHALLFAGELRTFSNVDEKIKENKRKSDSPPDALAKQKKKRKLK